MTKDLTMFGPQGCTKDKSRNSQKVVDQKLGSVAGNQIKKLSALPLVSKPTVYILIDVSIMFKSVELQNVVGAEVKCNSSLLAMLEIFKSHKDFNFKILIIGRKQHIEKVGIVIREDNDSKSQVAVISQSSEIEKTFEAYGSVDFLVFDVNQLDSMQFSKELIQVKTGNIKPQQLFCFSDDAIFLSAFREYGGVATRFTKAGEINQHFLDEVRKKFLAIDNKDYKVKKVFCDIDDTALLRPLTFHERKTVINPRLPVAEFKKYGFEWEVLTARMYFLEDIDFRAAQQQFISDIAVLFSDFNELLVKIEEWVMKINHILVNPGLHIDERQAIVICHNDITEIKTQLADFAPEINDEKYHKTALNFLESYYNNLQKLIGLCGNLTLKINNSELQQEYDQIKLGFDAIKFSDKLLELDSVVCHLSLSVAKIVHKFHKEWGCSLQVKKYSYTNGGQLGKKFQIIKQTLLAEFPDLGKNSQKALAVFFDDNPNEFNPAIHAKADLLKAGIELIVVPIHMEGEFYDDLPEQQQKELVANFLTDVRRVYNDAKVEDAKFDESDKENYYSEGNKAVLFQSAALGNVKKESGKQLAGDDKHKVEDLKAPAVALQGNCG